MSDRILKSKNCNFISFLIPSDPSLLHISLLSALSRVFVQALTCNVGPVSGRISPEDSSELLQKTPFSRSGSNNVLSSALSFDLRVDFPWDPFYPVEFM